MLLETAQNVITNIFSLKILRNASYAIQLTTECTMLIWKIYLAILESLLKICRSPLEKSIEGDIVLITGAGHGVGKELALQYADLDAVVVCVDINNNANRNTVAEIKKKGKTAFAYQCDITKRNKVFQTVEKIQKEVGDVTILVNNAGVLVCQSLLDHTVEEIQKTITVNVTSHFWMLQAVLPTMLNSNRGHIVALSSSVALTGVRNLVPYSASNFAVRGLMEGLKDEITRNSDSKIKFTTILPCIVDTGLCKNYSMRFPSITKVISSAEAAAFIISAQRTDVVECSIPHQDLTSIKLTKLLPVKVGNLLLDLVDVRFEPDAEK